MVRVITIVCDNSKAWAPVDFGDMMRDMFGKCKECTGCDCPCDPKTWEFRKCLLDSGEQLPSKEDADAFIISGSRHNVRDGPKLSWFEPLCTLIKELEGHKGKALVGICFGSQIVAHALGGEVDKNPEGFILLAETLRFTQALYTLPELKCCNTAVSQINAMEGSGKMIVSHGDSCVRLPPHACLLASSQSCENEMFTSGGNILCCQGHPEFEYEYSIAQRIWPAVVEKNKRLSEEKIAAAKASFEGYSQPFSSVIMLIMEFIENCVDKKKNKCNSECC